MPPDLSADYLALVAEGNRRVRLVGSADPETLRLRHWDESVYLGELLDLEGQHLVDVGSGAGFPGLALALARPGLAATLVEAQRKKAEFLETVVKTLGVADRVRVENRFLEARAGVEEGTLFTVRALERMERVPHWLGRCMPPGARAAFWVTRPRAELWARRYPQWRWGAFSLLPGSRERGIVVSVPRGTTP